MKGFRKVFGALFLAFTLAFTTACSTSFDAQKYVQATLDASTRAEFDEYIEITDSTEAEAQEDYDAALDEAMAAFDEVDLSDSVKEQYRSLFEDMFKATKYEVGEATEDSDGNYQVVVTIEPLQVFDGVEDELTEIVNAYVEEQTAAIENGGEVPTDREIYDYVFTELYNILAKKLENPTYGDPQEITVDVVLDEDENLYTISDEQIEELVNALIDLDSVSLS